jgi:hypothetical protein
MQTIKSKTTRKVNVNETKTRSRRVIVLLLLVSTLFWAAGCQDSYGSSPGYYSPGAYYEGNPADFLGHDRIYYRGPGYWHGRVHYVWTPGYWAFRTGVNSPARGALPNPGQLLWIHGRYIAEGY